MAQPPSQTNRKAPDVAAAALVALLVVQIIIGYEWLVCGITKVTSGTFVSGLAANLKSNWDGSPHWYKSFLSGTIIPNAHAAAVLIEVAEIAVGVVFVGGAIIWLTRWSRLSDRWRVSLLAATAGAALLGIVMTVNFHLARGGNHPWLIPSDGFDETVDLDMVLTFIQGVYLVFCGYLLVKIRREHRATEAAASLPPAAIPAAS
jgi:thiosulfate dehydrogenase [quinone] large subunit